MELFPISLSLFAADGNGGGSPLQVLLVPMIVIFVVYYFLVIRGGRREKQSREDMLNSLKKNDRIVTIHGIIGTVANISPDGKEVTLKIDDNARMKVLRSVIGGPLKEAGDLKGDGDKSAAERAVEQAVK